MGADTGAWARLGQEPDDWDRAGTVATLWWRDDDAVAVTEELDRLLELQAQSALPLCLAVIPEPAEAALAARLEGTRQVHAAVHGYRHMNHAPNGEKKAEFGADRPIAAMKSEIAAAWEQVHALFGDRAVAAFVPPWNRMTDDLCPHLPQLGLRALSRKAPRNPVGPQLGRAAAPRLTVTDVHLDIVDWRGTRGFIGDSEALTQLSDCLRTRRLRRESSPTGLLTHHAVMDEAAWGFLARLFAATAENRCVCWLSAPEVFNLVV